MGEGAKQVTFAGGHAFLAEPSEDLAEEGQGPLPFVNSIRSGSGHGFQTGLLIGFQTFPGNKVTAGAPLGRLSSVPFVEEEMLHGSEQERAELAFAPIGSIKAAVRQETREEFLRCRPRCSR